MNEIDWVILAVLFFSTILGVSRGVVREILAIVGWVLGIFLSLRFAPELAELIPLPSVSILIRTAFAAVGIGDALYDRHCRKAFLQAFGRCLDQF